jgi:hypothetical protein
MCIAKSLNNITVKTGKKKLSKPYRDRFSTNNKINDAKIDIKIVCSKNKQINNDVIKNTKDPSTVLLSLKIKYSFLPKDIPKMLAKASAKPRIISDI